MEKSQNTTSKKLEKMDKSRKILINQKIAVRDITLYKLASDLGTTPSILNRVISGDAKSKKVAIALCEYFGLCMDIIFPEYLKKLSD